jgi:hypothetical protein
MPTVVMENISNMGLLESDTDIVVLLDGQKELKFSRDAKVEFLVEEGTHTLQVKVGSVHSLPTTFKAAKGDVVGFNCSRSGIWEKNVVLTPLFHNRPHNRFDIQETTFGKENLASHPSKKHEKLHWSEVLKVAPHASMEEIQTAYNKLMRAYSPENFAKVAYEDSESMERKGRAINEAYEAARNEKKIEE